MTCPHCGEESKLERKGITQGAGFSDEEKEK
jgi:hypothetical protein